jgi:hypothetical protein
MDTAYGGGFREARIFAGFAPLPASSRRHDLFSTERRKGNAKAESKEPPPVPPLEEVSVFRRSKSLVAVAAVAAALATVTPAQAEVEVDPDVAALVSCRSEASIVGIQEWHQTVIVTGTYVAPGAIDAQLTCGIVRYGETVATVTESAPGPVAVVHGTRTVFAGPISTCYELTATYLDHTYSAGNCP